MLSYSNKFHNIKVSDAVYKKIQELRKEFERDIGIKYNNSQALYEYFKATSKDGVV